MRSASFFVWAVVLLFWVLYVPRTAALDDARTSRTKRSRGSSLSSGLPWDGRLVRAVRLRANASLHPLAAYSRRGNFYGTGELVALLERTASVIAARWPGSKLAVGELSARRGGKLDGHHSHRSGRDVDVAFFVRDAEGRPVHLQQFVTFDSEGAALRTRRELYFDDARNWATVAAMLRDPEARVQYMFVAQPIRTRLLMEGHRQGEGDEFLRVAAAVMVEPKEGHKHDNHFHVRIYCPRDDRPQCRDSEPWWPWYDGPVPDGKHADLPTIHWRSPGAPIPASFGAPKVVSTGAEPSSS